MFPISGAYDETLLPAFSWTFISSLLYHWFLPFLTVFLVSLGGWAIGMRNLVIYELENDSSRYLRALGATRAPGPQVRLPRTPRCPSFPASPWPSGS